MFSKTSIITMRPLALLVGLLVVMIWAMPLSAQRRQREPKMQGAAMFGVGISFTDSVVYQTEIQQLDSVWIQPAHKFLEDRTLYSLQLQYFMERQGVKNSVCAVYFAKNKRKLQRQWEKIRKRHTVASTQNFRLVPESEFRFRGEEYRPVIVQEGDE